MHNNVQTDYSLAHKPSALIKQTILEKALNEADEFRTGIFLKVDFHQILWGAISTMGPGTFLEISFKIGIAFNLFVSFNLYFRVFAFFVKLSKFFSVILVYMHSSRNVNY